MLPAMVVLTILVTITWLGLFITRQITDEYTWSVINASTLTLLVLFSVGILYLSLSFLHDDDPFHETYWGILIAWIFILLGEFTKTTSYLVWRASLPYPSVADFFWGMGIILLINELYLFTTNFNADVKREQLPKALLLSGLVIIGMLALVFNQVIFSGYDELYTPFKKAMDIFYFTADALILFFSIYIAFALISSSRGKLQEISWEWMFLILGMLLMVAGNTYFTYLEWNGNQGPYQLDEVLYVLQHVSWVVGAAVLSRGRRKRQDIQSLPDEIVVESKDRTSDLEERSLRETSTTQVQP